MVVLWHWDHTVLGELSNGVKVVLTRVYGGLGDKQTILIDPIKAVYSYFPGIKSPGFSTVTFTFENYPENSNIMYIQASADADGSEIGIIAFGV